MPANYPGSQTPATTTPWAAATHFAVNSLIVPATTPHLTGYYYKATSVSGTATTGGSEPSWPTIIGATVTDNAGANQIIWTCFGTVVSAAGPVAIQSPIDADTAGSSTTAVPVDSLSDWIAYLRSQCAFLNAANVWTGSQLFQASALTSIATITNLGSGVALTINGGTGNPALIVNGGTGNNNGISATGGSTGGYGVQGSANGNTFSGVYGVSFGNAPGVSGGSVGGYGGQFQGGGSSAGVNGIGGATAGAAGVFGQGGAGGGDGVDGTATGNGNGVTGLGAGTGNGISGTGGATAGTGGRFVGGSGSGGGIGVIGTGGTGSAPGGQFTGTGSSAGVTGVGFSGPGAQFTGNATAAALYLVPQTGLPSTPLEGYISYNSSTHHLEYYNGSAWVSL